MDSVHDISLKTSRGDFAALAAGNPEDQPVLALHGFPDGPWTFEALAARLVEAGFYVVATYMRGHHPSRPAGTTP